MNRKVYTVKHSAICSKMLSWRIRVKSHATFHHPCWIYWNSEGGPIHDVLPNKGCNGGRNNTQNKEPVLRLVALNEGKQRAWRF